MMARRRHPVRDVGVLDATRIRVHMSGSRHLAEQLGVLLCHRQARTLHGLPQKSINRRRCRAIGILILRAPSEGDISLQNTAVQPSDRQSPVGGDEVLNARRWQRILSEYSTPSRVRSIAELVITALPLVVLWAAAWFTFHLGHAWASLLIAIPAAGFLVRLFMIQHDCGHGSFFSGRLANDWVGRAIGVVTLTPYDHWRRSHARHHASSGNLDRRGVGDIDTLTVREFLLRPRWRQIVYRLYRNPIVMFGVGPTFLFILQQRLPIGMMRSGWMPWLSTMGTNLVIAILVAAMIWLVGLGPFLLIHLPITALAASIGVWLFFVQ